MFWRRVMPRILLVVFVLWSTTAFAIGRIDPYCAKALQVLHSLLEKSGEAQTFGESRRHRKQTVKIIDEIDGLHGGKLRRVRKIGSTWGSGRTTLKGFDPQGDPRWFIETLGPKAAAFFGFKMLSDTEMTVPDPVEFAGAIKRVNERLKRNGSEEISINFYESKSSILARYNRLFAERGLLPVATSENHYFHDMSYHSGAIFLPEYLVSYSRKRSAFIEAAIEHLKTRFKSDDPSVQKRVALFSRRIYMETARAIDNGTGLITPGVATVAARNHRNQEARRGADAIIARTAEMFLAEQSAMDLINKAFVETMFQIRGREFSFFDMSWMLYPMIKIFNLPIGRPNVVEVSNALREFAGQYATKNKDYDPFFIPQMPNLDEICLHITRKREAVREAVLTLMAES
jgi:hypothetical protein